MPKSLMISKAGNYELSHKKKLAREGEREREREREREKERERERERERE